MVAQFKQDFIEHLTGSFEQFPRKSAGGPGGSKLEHLYPMADDPVLGTNVAQTLVSALLGEVPDSVREAILAAKLNGLRGRPSAGRGRQHKEDRWALGSQTAVQNI